MVGGQAETFSCACRTRGVRVRLHEDEALAITPVPSAPFAGVPGDTIMTHLTHFVQFDALAPRAASGRYVLLANGTREYVEPPNATFANGTAANATASNATRRCPDCCREGRSDCLRTEKHAITRCYRLKDVR